MHPFWAVRRLTAAQLRKLQDETKKGLPKPRFNCGLTDFTMSNVSIAAPCGHCVNVTRNVTIQVLTNTAAVLKDEELILEISGKRPAEKKGNATLSHVLKAEIKMPKKAQ